MTPLGKNPEMPDSVEQEKTAEAKPEEISLPPFTEQERLQQQSDYIDQTLTDLKPAAQEDQQNLDQTEKTFQQEFPEPPAEFKEAPHTVEEVHDLEEKQQTIQAQLNETDPARQPQPEIEIPQGDEPEKKKTKEPPKTENRPRLPHEAPVKVEATREQKSEHLQQQIDRAFDKIYTEIENNGGQMPENPVGLADLKNVFKGSRLIAETTVNTKLERLKENLDNFQKDNGRLPSREEFKGLGKNNFRETIGLAAQENPQETQKSPYLKQQEERQASWQPGRSNEVPVQESPMMPQTEDKSRQSNRE